MKTIWMSVGMAFVMTTAFAQEKWGEKMKEHRAKMAEISEKLEAEWKTQDAELDKLVADAKSAPPEKKADALTAVVSKLVDLRKADHEKMANIRKTMTERMHAPSGESGAKSSPSATATPGQ